jgi:nucleotide-binding universal stress UspA family protein
MPTIQRMLAACHGVSEPRAQISVVRAARGAATRKACAGGRRQALQAGDMRWIVGIDFTDRSGGALNMAAWMRAHASTTAPQEFVAVHALPERLRRMMVREATVDAPGMTVDDMRRWVAESGVADPFSGLSADWAPSAEEGLTLAAANTDVTGIVIGRASGRESRGFGRLGRVARRLVRRLPAPVMVVPPDLTLDDVGKGPIVLATDLDPASIPAAETARDLARAFDRELLVVSVDETMYQVPALAPEAIVPLTSVELRTTGEVITWARARGLETAHVLLREGERVSTLLGVARERDAALIVCGSRCLSGAQRIFASSTASELARRGDRPVLVVPGHSENPSS